MIADTALLLALQWQLVWNVFRRRRLAWNLIVIVAALVFGGVALVATTSVGSALGLALRRSGSSEDLMIVPAVALTVAVFVLFLSSFGSELAALFLSRDMILLMSAPVDRRAVFLAKMLANLAFAYLMLAVFAMAPLIAYGVALRFGPLYYALVVVMVVGSPLLASGLGAAASLVVARAAPAHRVREALALAVGLFGLACGLLGQTTRVWSPLVFGPDPTAWWDALVAILAWPVPTFVAGRALAAAGAGDIAGALVGSAAYLGMTFGVFAGSVWLAGALYETGWTRLNSSGVAKRRRVPVSRGGWLPVAPPALAIALKDWRQLPRDLSTFGQMLWPLFFVPVIALNLVMAPRGPSALDRLSGALGGVDPTPALAAAGVLWVSVSLVSRLALGGVSSEAGSWWVLKTAPVTGWEIVVGKWLVAFAPFSVISAALIIGLAVWRGYSVGGALYGWVGIQLVGAATLAVAVGCSVIWATFDWQNPKQMISGWGALAAFVGQTSVMALGGLILAAPLVLATVAPSAAAVGWAAAIAVVVVFSLVVTGGILWGAARRAPFLGDR